MPRRISLGNSNPINELPVVIAGLAAFWRLSEGPVIREFEAAFASSIGTGRTSTFQAGRVALAAILNALEIRPEDEVIIPAYTCVAVPNPIIAIGACPIYADIHRNTGNIDLVETAKRITTKTKAIVVQHTFGIPAELDGFIALAKQRGLAVIEDCTHAYGAFYAGRPVGTFGNAAFFSMEQSKIISAGTGGMTYTEDVKIAEKIAAYQSICEFPARFASWRMLWHLVDIILFGGPIQTPLFGQLSYYLSRIGLAKGPVTTPAELACEMHSDILRRRLPAAIANVGLAQLRRFYHIESRRKQIAAIYARAFETLELTSFEEPAQARSNLLRYPIVVDDKARFLAFMSKNGVLAGDWFSAPVHPKDVDQVKAGYKPGSCPNAEWAVKHVANLPISPRMSDDDADEIVRLLHAFCADQNGGLSFQSH